MKVRYLGLIQKNGRIQIDETYGQEGEVGNLWYDEITPKEGAHLLLYTEEAKQERVDEHTDVSYHFKPWDGKNPASTEKMKLNAGKCRYYLFSLV